MRNATKDKIVVTVIMIAAGAVFAAAVITIAKLVA